MANHADHVMMRAALSLSLVALALGCTRANPAYRGPADGAPPSDATDSAPDSGDASADAGDGAGDLPGDANPDNPLACVVAMDCVTRNGAPPCATGAWACTNGACALSCPNCTDGDRDGYGVGTGCAGPDCDDGNSMIHSSVVQRSCYAGPAGTRDVGVCRAGSQSCGNGVWTTCVGQVIPGAEACNGEDDDCDGTVDDGLPMLTCGTGICTNMVPSCAAGVVAACIPHPAGDHDICDMGTALDNDCDGQINEECPTDRDASVPKRSREGRDDDGYDPERAVRERSIGP